MSRQTEFSPCRLWRYTLWREWWDDADSLFQAEFRSCARMKQYLMVIGLNPSKADETLNDPTIRRCIDFAKRWGFGALCMGNLFAYRDTDPEKMKAASDPIGPMNDQWLIECARGAGMVLAAWGKHGSHLNRARIVRANLENSFITMKCLKRNKDGSPQHPLYVAADTVPEIFT